MSHVRIILFSVACAIFLSQGIAVSEPSPEESPAQKPQDFIGASAAPPVIVSDPPVVAESSNSCEIVSCGMGIKETCKMTCPADKTPKCSCDCVRNIGPMCMEYKANCRCE